MPHLARTALVLQGGGALGAYELGAARRLYKDEACAPDVIAGVSIGAITAVLLARPAPGLKPLEALEAFWQKITVSGLFLPPPLRPYASALGNPNFFVPRIDYYALASWTNFYDTEPLRGRPQGSGRSECDTRIAGECDRCGSWPDRIFLQRYR